MRLVLTSIPENISFSRERQQVANNAGSPMATTASVTNAADSNGAG